MQRLLILSMILVTLILSACGGETVAINKAGIIGSWKVNLNSLRLAFGDEIPLGMQTGIELQKNEFIEQARQGVKTLTIEFTDANKMLVLKEGKGKELELDYVFDNNKLILKGTIQDQVLNIALTIDKMTTNKFTIVMKGEETLEEVRKNYPAILESAMMNFDAMAKGSSVTLSFKR